MTIDIFIPYWGDPEYLKSTVRSVLAQNDPDWRLTVVDDAYPDESAGRWVQAIDDERVRYVRKNVNEGITANYRTCVALAREEIMVMVGCDDELLPNYVAEIRAAHERFPEASVIQPGVEIIDEHGRVGKTLVDVVKWRIVKPRGGGYQLLSGEQLAANLLTGDWLYWPALAFRTSKIRAVDFRDGFPIIQDLALVMDMAYRGDQVLVVPTTCFRYRRHSQSASSSKLLDGSRFEGERDYFALAASQARALGWRRAEFAARARLTSRAHALTLLPGALRAHRSTASRALARHVFGA